MANYYSNYNEYTSSGIPSYEYQAEKVKQPVKELGQQEFLNLLMAQLSYQDPMEPQSDTEFMSQLSSFNQLEAMTNMSNMMSNQYYYSMVGKYVQGSTTDAVGNVISVSGICTRMINDDGTMYAQVGSYTLKASEINQVYDKDMTLGANSLTEAAQYIGREIRALTLDESGATKEIVGVVKRVYAEGGAYMAELRDGQKISISQIVDVKEIDESSGTDADGDTDTDIDTDTENKTDTDTENKTDTDTDTGGGTGEDQEEQSV